MNENMPKAYRKNHLIFYLFIFLGILYLGFAILQGGANYQREKKAASEEYREEYIEKIDAFRALEEQQIEDFLRFYENQEGKDAIAIMESYAEDLKGTQREKMRYFANNEAPPEFVGYQAYDYLASSLIVEGIDIILDNSEGEGRDFDNGVLLLEKGFRLLPIAGERYNTAKNIKEIQAEEEESK